MGSGSSKQPQTTQSAPVTARSTPSGPRRNKQFQEVQITQTGSNQSRGKTTSRSQGPTPNPNQSTSQQSRTPRDRDIGASGQTSSRQAGPRGKSTSNSMPSQQRKHLSIDQFLDMSSEKEHGKKEPVRKNAVKKETIVEKRETVLEKHDTDTEKQKEGLAVIPKLDDDPNNPMVNAVGIVDENPVSNGVSNIPEKTEITDNKMVVNGIGESEKTPTDKSIDKTLNGIGKTDEKVDEKIDNLGDVITKDQINDTFFDADQHEFTANHELTEHHEFPDHVSELTEHHDDEHFGDADHEIDEDDEHHYNGHGHYDDSEEDEEDALSMKEDDLVFETFYHRSGKEFQCIYQSGMRFYLDDWGSKEWQPFPKRWYNEGLLVTNTILKDDGGEVRNDQAGASGSGQGQSQRQPQSQGTSGSSDDREGFIMHPSKGRIPTYIFYKKHNVHMYFDKDTGTWVRLPIGWELHHPMVKTLVDQVEEAVPSWGDRHDILSLLRACNYDPDECISIYLHLEKDEWMKVARTSKEAKTQENREHKIAELEKKIRDMEIQLQKEKSAKEEALRENEDLTKKLSELEVENKQAEAQLSAATGGRPKTARPVTRLAMAGKQGKPAKGGKQVQAGEVVNPGDVLDLNENAKALRKAHTRLKLDVEKYMGELSNLIGKMGPAFKQLKNSEKGTMEEIEEVRALYRKEALQRKLLYNQLQELRGNIRVFCRARKDDRGQNCLKFPSDQDIVCIHPQQGKKMFSFDKVFDMASTQDQIFDETKAIITSCADGYNVSLLAYGQTGSGKTYTMIGPENNPGINIRAMKELFEVCAERKETRKYEMTVAMVEIYNEHIQDLLTSDAKTLELRTAGNKVDIPGLTYVPMKGVSDVKKVMAMGDQNRTTAATKMNSTSSRSHLVLMLSVVGTDKVTNAITRGTLTLCDLAGSERIAKTEAEGQRLVEAAAINKSLSALGQVFTALRSSQLHIPYRNSKLTQILQPSLGGDAKACLFVNVSPDGSNFAETVSTLSFGSNARQVALGQAKQNISKGPR